LRVHVLFHTLQLTVEYVPQVGYLVSVSEDQQHLVTELFEHVFTQGGALQNHWCIALTLVVSAVNFYKDSFTRG
jgi:hypothetical protein